MQEELFVKIKGDELKKTIGEQQKYIEKLEHTVPLEGGPMYKEAEHRFAVASGRKKDASTQTDTNICVSVQLCGPQGSLDVEPQGSLDADL
jgi:hypothetical protein